MITTKEFSLGCLKNTLIFFFHSQPPLLVAALRVVVRVLATSEVIGPNGCDADKASGWDERGAQRLQFYAVPFYSEVALM